MDSVEKAIREKIAYDIRAELVCCDEYDRVQALTKVMNANGVEVWFPEKELKNYHAICHWGECAARIAENPQE